MPVRRLSSRFIRLPLSAIKLISISLGVWMGLFSCTPYRDLPFSKRDVKGAQRVLGLKFTDQEVDSLGTWMRRNHSGIQRLRETTLDNSVLPALAFDPCPNGFTLPAGSATSTWEEPDEVVIPENRDELAFYPLSHLAWLVKNKKITSLELTQLYLDRINRYDDSLYAFVTVTGDLALEQAKRADAEIQRGHYRGALHGIPYGIKDLFAYPGYPTTWGAAPYKDQIRDEKATIIQRLEAAGAVLMGKLSSGELANGDVWFGGKTRNPWDLQQGASGSSAGSGSATAAGLVAFAIGTETWGSIVSPSTRCGITGLRPTYGRVSRAGGMTLSWTLDKVGPMCRTAQDCALVFEAIHGKDERDPSTRSLPFHFSPNLSPQSIKVGVLKRHFDEDSTDVGQNGRQALNSFQSLGFSLDSMELPERFPATEMMSLIIRSEAGAAFEELVMSNQDDLLTRQTANSRASSLRISYFMPATSYVQANRLRGQLIQAMDSVFQQYDVLLTPTYGNSASAIGNLTGHPVISLPTGWDESGHPTSITLMGRLYEEGTLLALAHLFQQQTPFEEEWPKSFGGKK